MQLYRAMTTAVDALETPIAVIGAMIVNCHDVMLERRQMCTLSVITDQVCLSIASKHPQHIRRHQIRISDDIRHLPSRYVGDPVTSGDL